MTDSDEADRMNTATHRTEYRLEGLLLARGAPDSAATWEPWGGPYEDLSDPPVPDRLAFLRKKKALAHSGEPQPELRILDYRVLRREVITTEWEEVETS